MALQISEAEFEKIKENPEDFKKIYLLFVKDIYAYAFRLVNNQHLAEDITSEAFVRAWKILSQFDGNAGGFKVWLYRAARLCALEMIRKDNRYNFIADDSLDNFVPEENTLEKELEIELTTEFINQKLAELPLHYQEILQLRYKQELSHKEIAQVINKQESTVRKAVSRAVAELKKLIFEMKSS